MKKKTMICIGILTAAFMFAGCGKNGESSSTLASSQSEESSNSTVSSEQEQPSTDELTLGDVLAAPETDASQFDWRPTEEGVYLRSCSSEDEIIVVPEEADGQPVIGVDANGLNYLDCRAIVLPDSVKYIETAALGVLEKLEVLVYGSGIENEESVPIGQLPALKILAVKEGAKKAPLVLAAGAENLEKVYLPASLEADFLSNSRLIFNCGDPTFIVEPGSAAEQYAIDNGYKYENP